MDDTITGSYYVDNSTATDNTTKAKAKNTSAVIDQLNAQPIDQLNQARHIAEDNVQHAQDEAFILAEQQIDKVRDFVGKSEHILGSNATKHGEIAEQVEVGVHNAKQALHQQPMTADIDFVSRTSPVDYYIDDIPLQSKFINGENNNLSHVLDHMDRYSDFIDQHGYYHIPKDYYATISNILNGEQVDGLKSSTEEAIKAKVATIEAQTGHNFDDIVRPSVSTYADVQLGNIDNTLNRHDADLFAENQQLKDKISIEHSANLAEGLYATGIAGGVTAGISLIKTIYQKHKAGKSIFKGDYTTEDWQDLGLKVGRDALAGGITGSAIYAITNYADLAALFAAATVSASKAIYGLYQQYKQNKISKKEFYNLALISCSESAMVGLATAAGQILIPIPVVGPVLGAIAGQMLINLTKGSGASLHEDIQQQIASFSAKLNAKQQQIFAQIDAEFKALGDLINAAFDIKNNVNLVANSVTLCLHLGVLEDEIFKNTTEIDDYMLG